MILFEVETTSLPVLQKTLVMNVRSSRNQINFIRQFLIMTLNMEQMSSCVKPNSASFASSMWGLSLGTEFSLKTRIQGEDL